MKIWINGRLKFSLVISLNLGLSLLFGGVIGCNSEVHSNRPQATAPHTARALLNELEDLIKAISQTPERGRELLATHTLTQAEVESLFEAPKARVLASHYTQVLKPSFLLEAPKEFHAIYKRGFHQVKLLRVGPNGGKRNHPGDLKLLESMPSRPALYSARFQLPDSERGLRVGGWVFINGRWATLLKLGELLEPWRAEELSTLIKSKKEGEKEGEKERP